MPPKMLDASKLEPGDCLSRIQYMTVVSIHGDMVNVRDERGFEWSISKSILESQAHSATQFTSTKKVTRTELARIAEQDIRDTVFSCAFTKMPNAGDQERILASADLSTPAKRKRVAKELGVGEERVLVGHITDSHELGRLPVYDLEAKGERLVDLRTLKSITYANTKYEVK